MHIKTELTIKPCVDREVLFEQFMRGEPQSQEQEDDIRSEILINGEPTAKIIEGLVLEAAVQWQDKTLLLVTYDCCYEECLGILLLNKEFDVEDEAWIGMWYSTGTFRNLQLIEPDRLRFNFFANELWEIQLLSKREIRIPFFLEPTGVSRRFGFSRRFIVRRIKPSMTDDAQERAAPEPAR